MRYLVFAYHYYYPAGGTDDIQHTTDSYEEAFKTAKEKTRNFDVAEVYDTYINVRVLIIDDDCSD